MSRKDKVSAKATILLGAAFLIAFTSPVLAARYDFVPPEMGEYTEVIMAFQNPDTEDYYPEGSDDWYTNAILDTGASANLITVFTQGFSDPDLGDWPGVDLPIKGVNTVEISGIGGTGYASVSHPVTVKCNSNWYMEAAGPPDYDVDFTGFPAEYGTQMIVATLDGSAGASADIAGVPFMYDYWTVIHPQDRVMGVYNMLVPYDGMAAHVEFFDRGDDAAPECREWIELSFPDGPRHNLDDPGDDPSIASSPRVDGIQLTWVTDDLVTGDLRQDIGATATGRFIVDTGAPISFMSSEIALAMGLDPDTVPPDDTKLIAGVTGDVVEVPGYYLDLFSIPTMDGDWLDYYGLMVYVLDILDEHGEIYTDGLLGSNLFFYQDGWDTLFFDMQLGLMGLNHPDFTDDLWRPPGPSDLIPEPATSLLLLTAVAALAYYRRRHP